jgi:uroporphyrinogen-III synthase
MRRVWVTREEDEDGPLCSALREAGLTPVLEPVIGKRVVDDCYDEVAALGPDDWLVLTSPYALEVVAREPAKTPRVAVVGEPSAERARELGFRVELVGEGTGASVWEELMPRAAGRRVCYPRSSKATPPETPDDVVLASPILYETTGRDFDRSVIERVHVIAIASPSAVRALGELLSRKPVASIGPVTSAAARELDVEPAIEAPQTSFPALADAIAGYRDRGHGD